MKVFVSLPIHPQGIDELRKKGYEVVVWQGPQSPNKEELIQACQNSNALISMLSDTLDEDFFSRCSHLKIVANYAVGTNNIDLSAAKKWGVFISNTPDVLTQATSDVALALMLCCSRNLKLAMNTVDQLKWMRWEPMGFLGPDLNDKKLGIVGMGRIGQCLAKKAKAAFNMEIFYHGLEPKNLDFHAEYLSFEDLLSLCDVVSVHCPLTPQTKGIFNKKSFQLMKKGSIFINTARGPIHQEQDLVEVLEARHLWAAGLDVTEVEPLPPDSPLRHCQYVTIFPHIGSATFETRAKMSLLCAQNIIACFENKKLMSSVL